MYSGNQFLGNRKAVTYILVWGFNRGFLFLRLPSQGKIAIF